MPGVGTEGAALVRFEIVGSVYGGVGAGFWSCEGSGGGGYIDGGRGSCFISGSGGDSLLDAEVEDGAGVSKGLTGHFAWFSARFSRTWIALSTLKAPFAIVFLDDIVSKRSMQKWKCWSTSSRSSPFSQGCKM